MAWRSQRLTWRLMLLVLALALCTAAIVVRLVQIQIIDRDYYAAQAEDEHLHQALMRAPRGAILDRSGYPLATTVGAFDVYIDPRRWSDDATALTAAAELASLLDRDVAELIDSTRAQEQGDYLVARSVGTDIALEIIARAPAGVKTINASKRFYPEGDLASGLLGFIGTDQVGLAGIEAAFDLQLGGVPGILFFEQDGIGNPIPFGRRVVKEPVPGGDLRITVDRYLQGLVENALRDAVERNGATGGSIIVMQPYTGEILAMASLPTYRLSELDFDDESQAALYGNPAVTDVYPPGSVMKTVTMAGAIDLGLVSPDSTYFDDGYAEVEGAPGIRNWDFSAHGTTTMTQLLQFSLNTGAVWLSNTLGVEKFYANIQRFGFGEVTHVGLGGEPSGLVRTNRDDGWYPIDLATNSFGQGISVTPLQMISAVGALVNGGVLMRPYIVKEVAGPEGYRSYQPVVVRRVVSEETSKALVGMMGAVVDGMPGHLAQTPGYTVGGKTGTTTFPTGPDTIATFIGFAPREDPRFIMLVKIDAPEGGGLGGVVAAPIFSELTPDILSYLGVEPTVAMVEGSP